MTPPCVLLLSFTNTLIVFTILSRPGLNFIQLNTFHTLQTDTHKLPLEHQIQSLRYYFINDCELLHEALIAHNAKEFEEV